MNERNRAQSLVFTKASVPPACNPSVGAGAGQTPEDP